MVSRATEHVVDDVKRVVANVKHVNKTFVDDMLMTSNMQEIQDASHTHTIKQSTKTKYSILLSLLLITSQTLGKLCS